MRSLVGSGRQNYYNTIDSVPMGIQDKHIFLGFYFFPGWGMRHVLERHLRGCGEGKEAV